MFLLQLYKERKNINELNKGYKLTNIYLKSLDEEMDTFNALILINEETVDFLYKIYHFLP